jgi:hypothetical protein
MSGSEAVETSEDAGPTADNRRQSPIKPPGDVSNVPDKYTRKAPDMTGPYADHRVFFIDTKFFKYGTTDQGHAAALVLSALLLIVILTLGFVALVAGADLTLLQFLIAPFSLVAGVAVGKSLGSKSDDKDG